MSDSAPLSGSGQPAYIPIIDELLSGFAGRSATQEFLDRLDLPAAILTRRRKNDKLRFVHINRAMSAMCGYKAEELVGQAPQILQGDETGLHAARQFRNDVETSGRGLTNLVNYKKSGAPYEVLLMGAEIRSDDTPGRVKLYVCFSCLLSEAGVIEPGPPREVDYGSMN